MAPWKAGPCQAPAPGLAFQHMPQTNKKQAPSFLTPINILRKKYNNSGVMHCRNHVSITEALCSDYQNSQKQNTGTDGLKTEQEVIP